MIEQLRNNIIRYNKAYRDGNPLISDVEYDQLIEELALISPDDELLNKVGIEITDESRKTLLPINMASMNKIKSIDAIYDWCRNKNISTQELAVLTPKLDGLSLCVDERTEVAITRGDGKHGQKSSEHYKLIGNHISSNDIFDFTYGEVMMSKSTFLEKYSRDFANPRNFVSGLLNSPDPRPALSDCVYIRYGSVSADTYKYETKQEILEALNSHQKVTIPYHVCKISDLTEDILIELFKSWSIEYEIDGIIIEINNLKLQDKLGRETSSNNPCFARAFKHISFEQSAETEILGITWTISKNGLLKPVAQVSPIKLDGVIVSNCTLNNAKFVKDMGLGVGAIVRITRSGMVIPKVINVIKKGEFQMPVIDGVEIGWNDNGIELITLTETDNQKLKKIIAFFEILGSDFVSEGVITQLWEAGYKTIKDILNLKPVNLEKIDRFGKRKAKIVYDSIQKCIVNVPLSKLQHATGIFKGLGSRKLVLLEQFKTKPTIDQVMAIEGFAEISAQSYIDGYDEFFNFISDLPITIEHKAETARVCSDFDGFQFVFTGIRDKNAEEEIIKRSGKIGSGVSKNTTHLVVKNIGSGSAKELKAIELGIKVITIDDLWRELKIK